MNCADSRRIGVLTDLSLISLCARAQHQPDIVQRDNGFNQYTAMGTGALASLNVKFQTE
jgi:hypothetical protein